MTIGEGGNQEKRRSVTGDGVRGVWMAVKRKEGQGRRGTDGVAAIKKSIWNEDGNLYEVDDLRWAVPLSCYPQSFEGKGKVLSIKGGPPVRTNSDN